MLQDRLIPNTLHGELAHGSQLLGGPKRWLKGQFKQLLKEPRFLWTTGPWQEIVHPGTIASGVQELEADWAHAVDVKNQQIILRLMLPHTPPTLPCPDRPQIFHSHLGRTAQLTQRESFWTNEENESSDVKLPWWWISEYNNLYLLTNVCLQSRPYFCFWN